MNKMVKCVVCKKQHEEHNFKHCDDCKVTGCNWCMSKGAGGVTLCNQCKMGKAKPLDAEAEPQD